MLNNVFEGSLIANELKFGIIVSRFNDFITTKLLDGALDVLERSGCFKDDIFIYKVPGSLEIAPLARILISKAEVDAIICLGTIIRGGTPHFDYVSNETAKGISSLALNSSIPVIFGVLTTDSIEQAVERAGTKHGNKGADAALTAIEMANLYKLLETDKDDVGFRIV